MPKLNPYLRIMRAARKGVGVNLTPEEVFHLSFDDAIATTAQNTLDDEEVVIGGTHRITKEGFEPIHHDCVEKAIDPDDEIPW